MNKCPSSTRIDSFFPEPKLNIDQKEAFNFPDITPFSYSGRNRTKGNVKIIKHRHCWINRIFAFLNKIHCTSK